MSEDRKYAAKADEDGGGGDKELFSAGKPLSALALKRGRKLLNAGELKEPRLRMFKELMALSEQYKRINQYQ